MRFLFGIFIGTLLLASQNLRADVVTVYLAAGQSNAKPAWASSIQSELRSLNNDSSVVALSSHAGSWLYNWYDEGVGQHYLDDLAVLNSALTAVTQNGDTPVFGGLFWFQGEGDTGSYEDMDLYTSRFNSMLDQYENDLSVSEIRYALMVIDADQSYDMPAGRTREQIDYMRSIHFDLGDVLNGVALDTRPYERKDEFHLTLEEQSRLGVNTATAFHDYFSPVPEPGSVSICMLVFTGLIARRRRCISIRR